MIGIRLIISRLLQLIQGKLLIPCLLYTSDAADERSSVDLGGRRIIKKKKKRKYKKKKKRKQTKRDQEEYEPHVCRLVGEIIEKTRKNDEKRQ